MKKLAITNLATRENHVIDWQGIEVLDRDSHKIRRQEG